MDATSWTLVTLISNLLNDDSRYYYCPSRVQSPKEEKAYALSSHGEGPVDRSPTRAPQEHCQQVSSKYQGGGEGRCTTQLSSWFSQGAMLSSARNHEWMYEEGRVTGNAHVLPPWGEPAPQPPTERRGSRMLLPLSRNEGRSSATPQRRSCSISNSRGHIVGPNCSGIFKNFKIHHLQS